MQNNNNTFIVTGIHLTSEGDEIRSSLWQGNGIKQFIIVQRQVWTEYAAAFRIKTEDIHIVKRNK